MTMTRRLRRYTYYAYVLGRISILFCIGRCLSGQQPDVAECKIFYSHLHRDVRLLVLYFTFQLECDLEV